MNQHHNRAEQQQIRRDLPELRHVSPDWEDELAELFEGIAATTDVDFFSPHPFTRAEAARIANYDGRDLYYILTFGREVGGYGILRGWDEGYSIPSLGITIARQWRHCGWGRIVMLFLHEAARFRGAASVRLKVHVSNEGAIRLYQSLGYQFGSRERDHLVGILDLPRRVP